MSSDNKNWFDIDRKGLAKLIERRGKIWLLHELIANAWDADGVQSVEVVLEPEEGVPQATVVVRDDAPEGFADMSHAWTLFAESSRKGYANKRGRFNLGEKLVLALCNEASIISTKGAVMFDARGRSSMKARRPRGTEFMGIARITRSELAEIKAGLKKLISPPGVMTRVNGEPLPARTPLKTIEVTLPTEIADDEGVLRRT
ncbi:MAG: ATP-binding protein, partial [Myxococcota bacterium]|nr:ATP-binding protein [Myxococcota bacterium]